MIEFPKDVEKFVVAGDWHGNYRYTQKAIMWAVKQGAQVIVHVGDFGYNFTKGYLNLIDELATTHNIVVMFVDGNHENFDWLLAQPVDADGVRRLRDRVWHLPRAFRWQWGKTTFMGLGGAHSVDKPWRVPFTEWWPQETLTTDDCYNAVSQGPVDIMFTHDCPSEVEIPGISGNPLGFSEVELRAANHHRKMLGSVVNYVKPKILFHGHYHIKYDEFRFESNTIIHGLDCDGNAFDKNMKVVEVSDLDKLTSPV
jgi:calcineurin-like phosphoesterase family protein